MTHLKSVDYFFFVFQVIPTCFLLRQCISMRPLINRTSIKRRYQQRSRNGKITALPEYFQESSKPTAKMPLKGYERRAGIREEPRRQNLRQLMLLDSTRPSKLMELDSTLPSKLISFHPKTSQQLTRVSETNEPEPAGRGHQFDFKRGFLQDKISQVGAKTKASEGSSDLMTRYQNSPSFPVTTTERSPATEDTVVKASFSASLTTSPAALLKSIRDICESLLNIFLPGFSLE